ncbi:hypothetical protein GCM10027422_39680 [Hymenobacter arcticus]
MGNFSRLSGALIATNLLLLLGCQKESSHDVGPKPATSASQNRLADPVDPPVDCSTGNCPPQYPTPLPVFYSTEGTVGNSYDTTNGNGAYNGPDNPSGAILDIVFTHEANGFDSRATAPDGYTVVPVNFNSRAGGDVIYMCFTRNPSKVATYQNSISAITGIRGARVVGYQAPDKAISTEHIAQWPSRSCCYYQLGWDSANMNGGIFATGNLNVLADHQQGGRPIEIGVLYNQDAGINPPTGWTKVPFDFNMYVGGDCDVVYLCYKYK